MTVAGLGGHWETMAPLMHSSWNDHVIQLSPLSSYAVLEIIENRNQSCVFCTPCLAVFPPHLSQLDLNPANLETTIEAEWILAFLFLRKRHFSMTSQLRHHYVVSCKYWWDILQFFQAHGLSGCFMPKIIKKLSKFVKVTAKILSVFFSTRCIYTPGECLTKITLDGWLQLCFMFLTKLQTDCCTCNNDKYTRKSPPDGRTQRHTHITHSVEIIDFCFEAPCLC